MRTVRRNGYTLIELTVIVAILAILASLFLPVFGQIRARARQAVCASHLHQIARAGLMYLADYDERFPSCYNLPMPPYVVDPRTSLQPYIRNWDLFYCPERHTVMATCLDPKQGFRPNARCMGYGYNWGSGLGWGAAKHQWDGLVRLVPGDRALIGVRLAEVATPAHTFFYGDTNDYGFITLLRQTMPGVRKGGKAEATTNEIGMPYEPPRHNGGNNFAFVDGHVKWLPFPGGRWIDGGPWVAPDMSMYSRTGHWESAPVP